VLQLTVIYLDRSSLLLSVLLLALAACVCILLSCRPVTNFKLPAGVADKLKPQLDNALSQVAALLTAEAEDDKARNASGKAPHKGSSVQQGSGKAAAL
jgi:hypothetical protein